jgi:hypothetical protein
LEGRNLVALKYKRKNCGCPTLWTKIYQMTLELSMKLLQSSFIPTNESLALLVDTT